MADITFYKNIPFAPDGSFTMDFLSASGAFSETTRSTYLEGTSRFYTSIALGDTVYIRDNVPFRVPYNIDALRNAGVNYFRFRNIVPDVTPAVYSRYYYGFIDKMTLAAADTTEIEWHIDPLQTYLSEIYSETYQQKIERCHQDRFIKSENTLIPKYNTLGDMPAGIKKPVKIKDIVYDGPSNHGNSDVTADIGFIIIVATSQLSNNGGLDESLRHDPPYLVQNVQNTFYYYIIPFFKDCAAHQNDFMATTASLNNNPFATYQMLFFPGAYSKYMGVEITPEANLFKQDAQNFAGMFYSPTPPFDIYFTKTYNSTWGGYNYVLHRNDPVAIDRGPQITALAGTGNLAILTVTNDFNVTHYSRLTSLNKSDLLKHFTTLTPFTQQTTRDPYRETKLYTSQYCKMSFSDFSKSKEIKNELITGDDLIMDAYYSIVGNPSYRITFINYGEVGAGASLIGITDFQNSTSLELPIVKDNFSDYQSRRSASIAAALVSNVANLVSMRSVTSLLSQVTSLYTTAARFQDEYNAPDIAQSVDNEAAGKLSMYLGNYTITAETPVNAVEICDFWALYGYPYDKPAKLSDVINTRYRFNYIKTGGARLPSVTYTEHKKALEDLLNNGVTFWHNHAGTFATIGDYSKENAEMSLL